MNKSILFAGIVALTLTFSFSSNLSYAHPHVGNILIDNHLHEPENQIIPINSLMGLEKSTILFHAPADNTLPWGFIEGTIPNNVEGYPVIIQIFRNNDAVHFAQTNVDEYGKYEYKFRVLNSDGNQTLKIFEGNYLVKVFKVVYLNQNNVSKTL